MRRCLPVLFLSLGFTIQLSAQQTGSAADKTAETKPAPASPALREETMIEQAYLVARNELFQLRQAASEQCAKARTMEEKRRIMEALGLAERELLGRRAQAFARRHAEQEKKKMAPPAAAPRS